ncbi:MAG: HAD-IA family hydrolase, partial [Jatrophihabitans sp.]|uniref:HAD-IA family hydrolase n=1 Tax=Jatrophihabitans sp. TaxID=1932789 RepID=UPI003F7FA41C
MPTVLLGSISTIADTSELQRRAFNEAFTSHGLDWSWSQDEYRQLITSNGGAQRIADYAAARGDEVDAAAVHRTKSEIFQKLLGSTKIEVRPGVAETIRAAKADGQQVALVTTTSPANVDALLAAVEGQLARDDFDLVVDSTHVDTPKPDGAVYRFALQQLGRTAADAVAIEDNTGGLAAAVDAGRACVAIPHENTPGHDVGTPAAVVDRIDNDQ